MTALFTAGLTASFISVVFLVIRYEGFRTPLDGLATTALIILLAGLAIAFTADTIQYRRWKLRKRESDR